MEISALNPNFFLLWKKRLKEIGSEECYGKGLLAARQSYWLRKELMQYKNDILQIWQSAIKSEMFSGKFKLVLFYALLIGFLAPDLNICENV